MRKVQRTPSIIRIRPRVSALVLLAALASGIPLSQADPVCDFIVGIPVDGNIPSSSTITVNNINSCFSDPGTAISNNGKIVNNPAATLTNIGVLNINRAASFQNYGALNNFTGAEIHVSYSSSFSNFSPATFINNGLFDVALSGWMRNEGLLINKTGATFVDRGISTNAIWATIINEGSYTTTGLTNDGDLYNQTGAQWTNSGQLALNVNSTFTNSGTLQNTGGVAISGLLINNSGGAINSPGSLILDKPYAGLINHGSINLSGTSGLTVSSGATVSGTGTINHSGYEMRVDGVLSQSAITVSHVPGSYNSIARLNGNGTIIAPVTLLDGSQITAGDEQTAGNLTIDGDLDLQGGILLSNILGTSAGQFDTLNVSGDIDLAGGTFKFDFGAFKPSGDDSWVFLVGDTSGLSLDDINFIFLNPKGFGFSVDVLDQGIQLSVTSYTAPVPVPAATWLFGSGIVGLIGAARRRVRSA